MASRAERDAQKEIRLLLSKISEAWLKGRPEELNECFHNDMGIKGPGFQEMGRGKEVCVKSYEDFIRQATVREFKGSDPVIDLWESTAVATFSWEIVYEMSGQDYHESGHDLLVLTRDEGRWQAVWRAILPSAQQ